MIDIRKLKELVRLMVANDLTEIDLRDSEEQVTLQRPSPNAAPQVVQAAAPQPTAAPAPAISTAPAAAAAAVEAAPEVDDTAGLVPIASPMVGTFYSAATPDAAPFMSVGDAVDAESVVCIVEAMKMETALTARMDGIVNAVRGKAGDQVRAGDVVIEIAGEQ